MRIDLTRAIVETAGRFGAGAPNGGCAGGALLPGLASRLAAARLAGLVSAIAFLGLVMIGLPARGAAATLNDCLVLVGVIGAEVVALVAARGRAWWAAGACGLLAVPFAVAAALPDPLIAGLAVLVMLDIAAYPVARRLPAGGAPALAIAGLLVLAGALAGAAGTLGAGAALAAIYAPILANAVLAHGAALESGKGRAEPVPDASAALLAAAIDGTNRQLVITDSVGTIFEMPNLPSGEAGESLAFPEGSVVSATLIVDRVALLGALSRAIVSGQPTRDLVIRLRSEPSGAGYPAPPRFAPFDCAVRPMPGRAGQAIITLVPRPAGDPAARGTNAVGGPTLGVSAARLSAAFHDCNGAFNAGLGFLEMIADARLAPRTIATYRDYAAEAHKAVAEAHRNALLLAEWVRALIETGDPDDAVKIIPVQRLISDAIRALNLAEAVHRGEIVLNFDASLPPLAVSARRARFAISVFLRYARSVDPCRLDIRAENGDLVLACGARDAEAGFGLDAFQQALEAAIGEDRRFVFGAETSGRRQLRLVDICAGAELGHGSPGQVAARGGEAPAPAARLAS